jgi:hypothetical protein
MKLRKLKNIKPHRLNLEKQTMLKKLMNEGKLGKMECEKIDKLDNQ